MPAQKWPMADVGPDGSSSPVPLVVEEPAPEPEPGELNPPQPEKPKEEEEEEQEGNDLLLLSVSFSSRVDGDDDIVDILCSDSDGEGDGTPEKDEFILVKLADIRKEVQCPICLGIIRKTRTVMECLHRFCRECIDKSMRLGNNECPACRTHCASRRSLRDDPNYDALVAALYPDIDKYEEEELAFHEEEKNRNKKIQASIAETLRRQTEALGKRRSTAKDTAAAFVRKSQGSYLRGRGRITRSTSLPGSEDEDEEDANGNDGKDFSSTEEPSPDRRQKRTRRWPVPQSSPVRAVGNTDVDGLEKDDAEASRENRGTSSPLRAGNREMLAWGRGGIRSQTRHGNPSGSNGRFVRGARMAKLVEYLRNLVEPGDESDVHLALLPLDEQSIPSLERLYLCCRPTLPVSRLCQFTALQTSIKAEEVEICVRKPQVGSLEIKPSIPVAKMETNPLEDLQVVGAQESLARLRESFTSTRGDLVLLYQLKIPN